MERAMCCEDCVQDGDCILQEDNEVEECSEYFDDDEEVETLGVEEVAEILDYEDDYEDDAMIEYVKKKAEEKGIPIVKPEKDEE